VAFAVGAAVLVWSGPGGAGPEAAGVDEGGEPPIPW